MNAPVQPEMETTRFVLYVCQDTLGSNRAIANLRRLGKDVLGDRYELRIVDVLEQPEVAERERIRTTPTLVKVHPPPVRRFTRGLGDRARLAEALGLPGTGPPE